MVNSVPLWECGVGFMFLAICDMHRLGSAAACKMLLMPFNGQGGPAASRKAKVTPPEETSQEAVYLKSLGEKQKPVSIKLADGEVVHGWIEYYDKNMLRLTREDGPNLFIFKHEIMYIAEDGSKRR
jgi:host factor-I protein